MSDYIKHPSWNTGQWDEENFQLLDPVIVANYIRQHSVTQTYVPQYPNRTRSQVIHICRLRLLLYAKLEGMHLETNNIGCWLGQNTVRRRPAWRESHDPTDEYAKISFGKKQLAPQEEYLELGIKWRWHHIILIAIGRRHELETVGKYYKTPGVAPNQVSHLCHKRSCLNPEHLVVESSDRNNDRKECKGKYISRNRPHPCPHGGINGRRCILPFEDEIHIDAQMELEEEILEERGTMTEADDEAEYCAQSVWEVDRDIADQADMAMESGDNIEAQGEETDIGTGLDLEDNISIELEIEANKGEMLERGEDTWVAALETRQERRKRERRRKRKEKRIFSKKAKEARQFQARKEKGNEMSQRGTYNERIQVADLQMLRERLREEQKRNEKGKTLILEKFAQIQNPITQKERRLARQRKWAEEGPRLGRIRMLEDKIRGLERFEM